jgi:aminomethyltransferase
MHPPGLINSPFADYYYEGVDQFIDVNGYAAPLWISSPSEEYALVRERVGLLDSSMLFKLDVEGPTALDVVNRIVTRDLTKLAEKRVAYTAITDENGGMIDDATVIVFSPDRVRVTGANSRDEQLLRDAASDVVSITEVRDTIAHLCIQGPRSRDVLSALTDTDVSNGGLPYYNWAEFEVAGIPALVARLGFTAELGYEISVPAHEGLALYEACADAGATHDIQAFGGAALMMMRIEAGMIMGHGADFDDTVTPFECNLEHVVALDKPFLGRDALVKKKDEITDRLVTIALECSVDELGGSAVLVGDQVVGKVTSAIGSPMLDGNTLAMARVNTRGQAVGTRIKVQAEDGQVDGEVVTTPFYDPARTRARS